MEALGQQTAVRRNTPPLPILLDRFEEHLSGRGYADRTVVGYVRDLRLSLALMGKHRPGPLTLAELTLARLQRHIDSLCRRWGLSAATVNRRGVSLRRFFKYVSTTLKLCTNEAQALLLPRRVRRRLPPTLSLVEVTQLVEAPLRLTPERERTVMTYRDAALLETLFGTGMRNSETSGVDQDILKLRAEGHVAFRIIGKGDKERLIVVEAGKTVEALKAYVRRRGEIPGAADNPALFLNWYGGRLTDSGIRRIVHKWAKRCGLEAWPHLLRHTFATVMVEACGEALRGVQELMGHDDPETTATYDKINEQRLLKTARCHPRAVPSGRVLLLHVVELAREAVRYFGHVLPRLFQRIGVGPPVLTLT